MKRAPGDMVKGAAVTAKDGGGSARPFVDSQYPTVARGPATDPTVEVGAVGDLQPGMVLGKYRVVKRIAGGGMGAVYEAIHTGISKPVALKTMSPTLATDPRAATRFLREAGAASRLDHPHVVDVTDFGTDSGVSYLVMELLRGQDLSALIAREPNGLDPSLVADVMLAVCAGVFAAHESGVVHRDLKPQNIFLARTPLGEVVPKVLDFGISKRLDDELETGLTSSGAVMGTTHYLSPEQVAGRPLDLRSDQYSLGVILYEALTGRRPHDGTSMFAVMQSIGAGRFPQPRLVRPEIPVALEAVILKAMSARPADRFESVHGLGASLMAFASPKRRIMWSDYYERGRPAVTPAPGSYARIPLPAVCAEGGTVALDLKKEGAPLTPTQTRARESERREAPPVWKDTRSEPRPVPVLGTEEYLRTNPIHRTGPRRVIALLALLAGGVSAYTFLVEPRWRDRLPDGASPPGPAVERAGPGDPSRSAGPASPASEGLIPATPPTERPAGTGAPDPIQPAAPPVPAVPGSSTVAAPRSAGAPRPSSPATGSAAAERELGDVDREVAGTAAAGRVRAGSKARGGRPGGMLARKKAADLEGERALGSLFPQKPAPVSAPVTAPWRTPQPAAVVPPAVARPTTAPEAARPAVPSTVPPPVTPPPVPQLPPRPIINPGGAPILE
jgi:eukaryotic-like serine/threonine-protein kinase